MKIRGGMKKIQIPEKVTIKIDGQLAEFTGPKGVVKKILPKDILIKIAGNEIEVSPIKEDAKSKSYYNLTLSLINSTIKGVAEGWEKTLEMEGVGYRAEKKGENLILTLGFSHPVEIKAVPGISFSVEAKQIKIAGADAELIGDVAAKIRNLRSPEPYKGKGIHYLGEHIRRKPGKAGKVGGAA